MYYTLYSVANCVMYFVKYIHAPYSEVQCIMYCTVNHVLYSNVYYVLSRTLVRLVRCWYS